MCATFLHSSFALAYASASAIHTLNVSEDRDLFVKALNGTHKFSSLQKGN